MRDGDAKTHRREMGRRMREAREALRPKMSQEKIGRLIAEMIRRPNPYTAANVGNWESGEQRVDTAVVRAWAELTKCSVSWLMTDIHFESGALPTTDTFTSRGGRVVPKITLEQASAEKIDYTTGTVVHTQFPCSRRAFVLDVFDNRNSPEYREGIDRIVIDPEEMPRPGDMALALIDQEPVFGKFVRRGGGRGVLEALNTAEWDAREIDPQRGDRIIGTMTEHTRQGRVRPV